MINDMLIFGLPQIFEKEAREKKKNVVLILET
jgi:hypothetical protein